MEIGGRAVPVSVETVLKKPFCHLLHFRKEMPSPGKQVLIVAPLSGHHSTLLRDTVRTMLRDFDVYITDWVDARMVPLSEGPFHLDDYVDYVKEFIRLLGPELSTVSVCQPTVPVLGAISLLAQEKDPNVPKAIVMMGGPIDPRRNPTVVNEFAMGRPHSWFEDKVIERVPYRYPGFMRRVYPGFLQHLSFMAMNADRHVDAHRQFFNHLVSGMATARMRTGASTTSTTPCWTWPRSTTSTRSRLCSRILRCPRATGTCAEPACSRPRSAAPR